MMPRTLLWSEDGWGLWKHNISNEHVWHDRGSWGVYMLFHRCGRDRGGRASKTYDGEYMCVRCAHRAPDGAVGLLEMMNWDEE